MRFFFLVLAYQLVAQLIALTFRLSFAFGYAVVRIVGFVAALLLALGRKLYELVRK